MQSSVLVYNVSHSDLILGVANASFAVDPRYTSAVEVVKEGISRTDVLQDDNPHLGSLLTFARPKFSFVEPLANEALDRLKSIYQRRSSSQESRPKSEEGPRADNDNHSSNGNAENNEVCLQYAGLYAGIIGEGRGAKQVLVGFSFVHNPIIVPWSTLHLRGSAEPPPDLKDTQAKIVAAYIPLAAQLIPAWLTWFPYSASANKCVLLICGTARPQDLSACLWGNSTLSAAMLISRFLKHFVLKDDDTIDIQVVDSSMHDVFDYDQNVSFIRTHLMPRIEQIRRIAAGNGLQEWRSVMDVTVALTEGSPARLGAVQAALRTYRPWYAHLGRLKTFWHEKRLLARDLSFYSFERVETTPPLVVESLEIEVYRAAVAELCRYRDEIQRTIIDGANELRSFWLRKSNKPVLSVLVVKAAHEDTVKSTRGFSSSSAGFKDRSGSRYFFYRGINLEVSQPTGSLCSERNAIGTALAANPALHRKDVILVAVLGMPKLLSESVKSSSSSHEVKRYRGESICDRFQLGEGSDMNPLGPCGACTEWLKKIAEVNPDFKVITFRDISCRECFIREVE